MQQKDFFFRWIIDTTKEVADTNGPNEAVVEGLKICLGAAFLIIAEEQRKSAAIHGTTLSEFFEEYEKEALNAYYELLPRMKKALKESLKEEKWQ